MIKVHNDSAKNHLEAICARARQRVVQLARSSRNPKELANLMPSCATTYNMLSMLFSVKSVFFFTGGGAAGGCSGATSIFVITGTTNRRGQKKRV
jgi:hypothetical protein